MIGGSPDNAIVIWVAFGTLGVTLRAGRYALQLAVALIRASHPPPPRSGPGSLARRPL